MRNRVSTHDRNEYTIKLISQFILQFIPHVLCLLRNNMHCYIGNQGRYINL